jgi:hypothetical protein
MTVFRPQPPPPKREHSFTSWHVQHPNTPTPGDWLDSELSSTHQAFQAMLEWAAVSLNSDGSLRAEAVRRALNLDPSTQAIDNSDSDNQFASNVAQDYAVLSAAWAEHMPDTIPPNILAANDITGDHWSSRWWANLAARLVQDMDVGVGGVPEAPLDNRLYGRKSAGWVLVPGGALFDVRNYGAKGDGSTDDAAAIQSALTDAAGKGAAVLYLPAGRYLVGAALHATLNGNAALAIRGDGSDLTELVFTNATDGVVITYASNADFRRGAPGFTGAKAMFVGFSVVRGVSTVGNDGLKVLGDTHNETGLVQPDTRFGDLVFRGDTQLGCWNRALVVQDCANTDYTNISITALWDSTGAPPSAGTGIAIIVANRPVATAHTMLNVKTTNTKYGVYVGSGIQGLQLNGCNFSGGDYGIYWDSHDGRQEQLAVNNTQFSNLVAGVFIYYVQDVAIIGCTFYNQNSYLTTPGNWVAMSLNECCMAQIVGNTVNGIERAQEYAIIWTNDVVLIDSDECSVVSANNFMRLNGAPLQVRNTTGKVLYTSNSSARCHAFPQLQAEGSASPIQAAANLFDGNPYAIGFPGTPGLFVASLATSTYTWVNGPNTIMDLQGNGNLTAQGSVTSNGFTCRAGLNGAVSTSKFHLDWVDNSHAELWIDASRVGKFALTTMTGDLSLEGSLTANGYVTANAFTCRAGILGAPSSSRFNIDWTGVAPDLWIDDVRVGTLTTSTELEKVAAELQGAVQGLSAQVTALQAQLASLGA